MTNWFKPRYRIEAFDVETDKPLGMYTPDKFWIRRNASLRAGHYNMIAMRGGMLWYKVVSYE